MMFGKNKLQRRHLILTSIEKYVAVHNNESKFDNHYFILTVGPG